jgi:hypothetical protein
MAVFCYSVALTAATKAENSTQFYIACSYTMRLSLRIRNHMQKWFNLLISDPSGIEDEKKTEGRKSRETAPLNGLADSLV